VVAGAWLVLDEHLLAPHRRKLVREHACDNIRRTSRGDRHNDAYRFVWVAGLRRLRARRQRPRRRRAEQGDKIPSPHGSSPRGSHPTTPLEEIPRASTAWPIPTA